MKILKLADKFTLACQYPGQTNPQPCYIALDLQKETLTADYDCEIGNAVPVSVYLGHVRRYEIPCLTADAVNGLLDEIAPLAERVITGYASAWNGNNNIAKLSQDAQDAEGEIEAYCGDYFGNEDAIIAFWDISDWLDNIRDEARGKTDAELDEMAANLAAEAEDGNIYLGGSDILGLLQSWRDEYALD